MSLITVNIYKKLHHNLPILLTSNYEKENLKGRVETPLLMIGNLPVSRENEYMILFLECLFVHLSRTENSQGA